MAEERLQAVVGAASGVVGGALCGVLQRGWDKVQKKSQLHAGEKTGSHRGNVQPGRPISGSAVFSSRVTPVTGLVPSSADLLQPPSCDLSVGCVTPRPIVFPS